MSEPKVVESGISPSLYCACGEPATYHKRDDGTTLFHCDYCNQVVGHSRTGPAGMSEVNKTRDLLEDRDGDYPAHITIRDFQYGDSGLVASLWLGNENEQTECEALLTDIDVRWIIQTLQQTLDGGGHE